MRRARSASPPALPTRALGNASPESSMFPPQTNRAVVLVATALLTSHPSGQTPPAMRDTIDPIPGGWSGPVFQMSKDYPTSLPADPKPWKAYDFKTQPQKYMGAILAYALEGN